MEIINKEQYLDKVSEYMTNPELRKGQCYMVALNDIEPEIYNEITNTEYDCFYDDTKIISLLNYLKLTINY